MARKVHIEMPVEADFTGISGFTVANEINAAGCFAVHDCLYQYS
jgi:hypothetical protein